MTVTSFEVFGDPQRQQVNVCEARNLYCCSGPRAT